MVTRRELVTFLDDLLRPPAELKDSSRNGLQVEGTDAVHRVAFGVDASLALFQAAAAWDAQAIVVHHGLFWHEGFSRVLGAEAARLRLLLGAGLNLYASHVPLDCHPRLGNNAVIASRLGLLDVEPFGIYGGIAIGYKGKLATAVPIAVLADHVAVALETTCRVLVAGSSGPLASVGIISGGGADLVSQCPAAGVACLITGELTHQCVHPAWEAATPVIAAGHYATEVWGLRALMAALQAALPVQCRFLNLPTGY
jgi:dinuclear metal center YbgI/SA1388 family protein